MAVSRKRVRQPYSQMIKKAMGSAFGNQHIMNNSENCNDSGHCKDLPSL